jgi:2-haloacid dehalogenase
MDLPETLVFDVMGTVVDDETAGHRQATALLAAAGLAPERTTALLKTWEEQINTAMDAVRREHAPWEGHERLRRAGLLRALDDADLTLAPELIGELSAIIHRLRPWPDSAAGLAALRASFKVVALSNADPAELIDLSVAGGLAWHGVLSAAAVRSFKPDPAVYRMALDQLGTAPGRVMMVAAHPWDLRAAAREGFATAYIARPGAERPAHAGEFTVTAGDLLDLARLLAPDAGE